MPDGPGEKAKKRKKNPTKMDLVSKAREVVRVQSIPNTKPIKGLWNALTGRCGRYVAERIAVYAGFDSLFAMQLAANNGDTVMRYRERADMVELARNDKYWSITGRRGHSKDSAIIGYRPTMSAQFIMHVNLLVARYVCLMCERDMLPCALQDLSERKSSVRNLKGFSNSTCYMCNIAHCGYVTLGKAMAAFDATRFAGKPCEHALQARRFPETVDLLRFVHKDRIRYFKELTPATYKLVYRCLRCRIE